MSSFALVIVLYRSKDRSPVLLIPFNLLSDFSLHCIPLLAFTLFLTQFMAMFQDAFKVSSSLSAPSLLCGFDSMRWDTSMLQGSLCCWCPLTRSQILSNHPRLPLCVLIWLVMVSYGSKDRSPVLLMPFNPLPDSPQPYHAPTFDFQTLADPTPPH